MPPSDLFDDSEVQGLGKLVFLVVWECGKACKGYFLWFAGLARGRNGAFLGFVGLARGRNGAFLGFAGLARGRNGAFLGFARAASEEKGGFFAVARAVNLLRGSFLIVSRAANYQQGSFLIVSRTANYQQGSFLIVSRAANSQQGSFFTLCTVCKLLARVLFHSLHGVQTPSEGDFFKGGESYNSESRRKSDFLLFLPLQERVEILGLFFRMRVFYLRCLWRCECCYWGCLRCIAFFFLRSLLNPRLLIYGRVLTGRNLPGRATPLFLITLKCFGGTGMLTILLGRKGLFLWRASWRERYFCVKIWMNVSFLGGSLAWNCGRSFPKEKNSTLLEILFT